MPSLFPSFDVSLNTIKVLKIANMAFNKNNISDPIPLILVGNELYRLSEKSLKPIAVLTDTNNQAPAGEQTYFDIIDIQACQWDNRIIFIANLQDIYNVYLMQLPRPNVNGEVTVLTPIQKIKKHGQIQITTFFHFSGNIYCLLAANYLDDHR